MFGTIRAVERDLPADIRQDLVAQLSRNLAATVAIALMFAVVGTTVSMRSGSPVLIAVTLCGIALSAVRVGLIVAYRWRRRGAEVSARGSAAFDRCYGLCSIVFGGLVGIMGTQIMSRGDHACAMLYSALLIGFGAGQTSRVAVRPWICLSSVAAAAAGPIVAAFARGDPLFAAQGAILLILVYASADSVRHNYLSVVEMLTTRREFRRLARHDALTGLPNRLMFRETLEAALAAPAAEGGAGRVAVLYVDLDQFKPVNDRLGHPVGDAILKETASRLTSLLRDGDLAARLGGDEFAVVLASVTSRDEAALVAARLVRGIAEPFRVRERTIRIGASVGIAMADAPGTTAAALTEAADAALYGAKLAGRNRYSFWDEAEERPAMTGTR